MSKVSEVVQPSTRLLVSQQELAKLFGCSERFIRGLKELPSIRIGRLVKYDVEDVRKWMDSKKAVRAV